MFNGYILLTVSPAAYYSMGILYVLLWSLLAAAILVPIYYVSLRVFNYFKKKYDHWIFDSLISSFLLSFLLVIVMYLFPFVFLGWSFDSYIVISGFWAQLWYTIKLILSLMLTALIYALLVQPFIMLISALNIKYEGRGFLLRIYLPLYIISVIILFLNLFFPWLLGGVIMLVYF